MKIISLFLSIILMIPSISLAEENKDGDYQEIKQGEAAPYDGYLFSEDGMINIVTKVETRFKQLEIDRTKEKSKIVLDYEVLLKNKQVELDSSRELYLKQLQIKQDSIDAYRRKEYWNNFKLASGIAGGILVGYLIFTLTSLK